MDITITINATQQKGIELYAVENGILDGNQAPDVQAAVLEIITKTGESFVRQEFKKQQLQKTPEQMAELIV